MAGFRTYLVVPVFGSGDFYGQPRIVAADANARLGLNDYRDNPGRWREVGLTDGYRGNVVCLDAPADVLAEFRECEPIRPPLTIYRGL